MTNTNFKDKLRKQIKRMGYPLEIETASILESRKWAVFPNRFYIDMDTKKTREIDISAFYKPVTSQRKELEPLPFSPLLFMECKKSEDHFLVLFPRKKSFTFYDFTGQTYDFPVILRKISEFRDPIKEFNYVHVVINGLVHYKQFKKVASSYKLIKPNSDKDKEDIYEVVMQLIKAQIFDVEQALNRDKSIKHTHYPIFFSFLAIVFDGKMFEAKIVGNDIDLEEVSYGLIRAQYMPSYSDHLLDYQIDVVKREYLNNYLSQLEQDIYSLKSTIMEHHSDMVKYLNRQIQVYTAKRP